MGEERDANYAIIFKQMTIVLNEDHEKMNDELLSILLDSIQDCSLTFENASLISKNEQIDDINTSSLKVIFKNKKISFL
jgi:hypothetical protein